MVSESGLDLKRVIDFLKDANSRSTDWEEEEVEGELIKTKLDFKCELQWEKKVELYDIEAREFLSFARQDSQEDSERGRVNALSNAAKAIGCRVDELLALLNFKGFSLRKSWNLPYKLKVLQSFGIPAPDVLKRLITSKRNLLEHEYVRPRDQEEIGDVVGVAGLYLDATDRYVEKGYITLATVTRTQWFKPAVFAPTWFRKELGESGSPKFEYEDGSAHEYKVEFGLEDERVTLTHLEKELYHRRNLKTGETKRKEHVNKEEKPVTIPMHDCKMEDVRELMILLREKGT